MRSTIIIGTVLLISTGLLISRLMPEKAQNPQTGSLAVQIQERSVGGDHTKSAYSKMREELQDLTNVILRLQEDSQEQLKQEKAERARWSDVLADLGNRIRALESASNNTAKESAESQEDAEDLQSKAVSEGDLGHWMDEALHVRDVNRESTELAIEQAEKNLEKIPGVFLDDMSCGGDFCRASFSGKNNEHPALHDLFGMPPFDNEGFTINEPDGRVTLYFTQPGVSLEDLRSEAQQAAMFDMDPW